MAFKENIRRAYNAGKAHYEKLSPKQKALVNKLAVKAASETGKAIKNTYNKHKLKVMQKPKKVVTALVASDMHSGITSKHLKVVINAKKPKNVSGMPITYYESSAGVVTAPGSGYQSSDTIIYGATYSQWNTNVVIPGATSSVTRYFDLNPAQTENASTLYGAVQMKPAMDRLCLEYCTYNLDLTNFTNEATTVDVYIYKCKKNCNQNPSQFWATGLLTEANGLGATAPVAPSGAATITGQLSIYQPYLTPVCKQLNEYWQKKRVHRVLLASAATETILFDIVHNFVGKQEYFTGLPNAVAFVPGTVAFMLVCKGSPMHVVAQNECSLSNPVVGWTVAKKSVFKPVMMNAARIRVEVGNQ